MREKDDAEPEILLQPGTKPISHNQLVVEVKGIYAGLVMVEAKCIDIDERQSVTAHEKYPWSRLELRNDQWQSLIALYKQLLHEHHHFFLASQHASASIGLSRLPAKYSMPATMWRHGIHTFLEVVRHRLPGSLEHTLAFNYLAYSMMALLYETAPAFEDTWIECLGDLGRSRMAIEDDEPRDRGVWSDVALFWYKKASNKNPSAGRLYHHLAILARPYTLEQVSLYTRSLTCVIPFESAKGSVMKLFNPVICTYDSIQYRASSFETIFIKIHALLFTIKYSDESKLFNLIEGSVENLFQNYITNARSRFQEIGVYISVSNIAALFEYGFAQDGLSKSRLRLSFGRAQLIKRKVKWKHQGPEQATDIETHSKMDVKIHDENEGALTPDFGGTWISPILQSCKRYISVHPMPHQAISRFRVSFACVSLLLPATIGSPLEHSTKDRASSENASPIFAFSGWLYLLFAVCTLLMAQFLASKKGRITVWGAMMAVLAYAWWVVKDDTTTTLWLSGAVFLMWMFSALQYGLATYHEFGIPESVTLIVVVIATLLDVSIVAATKPNEASISQGALISLSLPSTSFTLIVVVNLIGFIRLPHQTNREVDQVIPLYHDFSERQFPRLPGTTYAELPAA